MGSVATKKLEGFVSLGGELPHINPNMIKIVGLDIEETPDNWYAYCPRTKDELEDEWVADIRQSGVRTAIDCFRDGDTLVALDGRRRIQAARRVWAEQAKKGVPENQRCNVRVAIRRADPLGLFAYNIGSESRKSRTPLQSAALMLHAQKFGATDEVIAKIFGCTRQTVKNTLALLDLDPKVAKAVDNGEFPLREAIKLAPMERAAQKELFETMKEAGATKGPRAANAIAKAKRGEKITKEAASDATKMRSRIFLEKLKVELKKDRSAKWHKQVDLVDLLGFVMGSPPRGMPDEFKETLVEIGYRG
jgi:predicted transcriptional regulator